MEFYSTNNKSNFVSLKHAVLKGLPEDNGLYMPKEIPLLPDKFFKNIQELSFQELSFIVAESFIGKSIPKKDLEFIIYNSISIPSPIVKLANQLHILELFHGPTLAFKDFGARFMAHLMSYFNRGEKQDLNILVATSGDTGGAVASGFYNIPGIKVVILYPSGKVSPLQDLQLTTFGNNITPIKVDGTFDDCQNLVKLSFLDNELNNSFRLTSANSINIARLIPQSFYYFEAFKQLKNNVPPVFSIPSGNLGNLTAGLFAKKMGLPVLKFIAASNINDVFLQYLGSGKFYPKKAVPTISNAMDVGNPSNFYRILDIYGSTWNRIKKDIVSYRFNDSETKKCIEEVYNKYNYILDPHGAIGFLAYKKYIINNKNTCGIILETAHPSKFFNEVEPLINTKISIPERLSSLSKKKKENINLLDKNYSTFKSLLFDILT
jgi:threonine synthase